jgi:hypothetical protein
VVEEIEAMATDRSRHAARAGWKTGAGFLFFFFEPFLASSPS